jgi:hypothetical protein
MFGFQFQSIPSENRAPDSGAGHQRHRLIRTSGGQWIHEPIGMRDKETRSGDPEKLRISVKPMSINHMQQAVAAGAEFRHA